MKNLFYVSIIISGVFINNSIKPFSVTTGDNLNRLTAIIEFENAEKLILEKGRELAPKLKAVEASRAKRAGELKKNIDAKEAEIKKTNSEIAIAIPKAVEAIRQKIKDLEIKKATAAEIRRTKEVEPVAEGLTTLIIRTGAKALTGYGEQVNRALDEIHEKNVQKKIDEMSKMAKAIDELNNKIEQNKNKLNNVNQIKEVKELNNKIIELQQKIAKLKETISNPVTKFFKENAEEVKKAEEVIAMRNELFKKTKCSSTTPSAIRQCKKEVIDSIKKKHSELKSCKALTESPSLAQVSACRAEYDRIKK